MIEEELVNRLRGCLGHVPTMEQERAMMLFAQFLMDREMVNPVNHLLICMHSELFIQ